MFPLCLVRTAALWDLPLLLSVTVVASLRLLGFPDTVTLSATASLYEWRLQNSVHSGAPVSLKEGQNIGAGHCRPKE